MAQNADIAADLWKILEEATEEMGKPDKKSDTTKKLEKSEVSNMQRETALAPTGTFPCSYKILIFFSSENSSEFGNKRKGGQPLATKAKKKTETETQTPADITTEFKKPKLPTGKPPFFLTPKFSSFRT